MENRYIIANLDLKHYLRPETFGEHPTLPGVVHSYDGVMQGLVALLADSNGRGGGDLRSDSDLVGSWAGHRILILDNTVTDPALSWPGQEAVPLLQQFLEHGVDQSDDVVDLLIEAEGDYTELSYLRPRHCLPLTEQRKLSRSAQKLLLNADGRELPFEFLEEPFEVLGVSAGLSPFTAQKRVQEGIDKMAAFYPGAKRPQVVSVALERGEKPVRNRQGRREMRAGVSYMAITLQDEGTSALRNVSVWFNEATGTTTRELYTELLGVSVFETPLALLAPSMKGL